MNKLRWTIWKKEHRIHVKKENVKQLKRKKNKMCVCVCVC